MSAVERGTGIVWLDADVLRGDYLCQWYVGAHDDVLAERARAGSSRSAVRWAQARSPRIRILTGAGVVLWAGTGPKPDDYAGEWIDDGEVVGRMPVP